MASLRIKYVKTQTYQFKQKVYMLYSCYANKNRICWPSISTLADDCGSSQSSIKRWIKELKSYNYIRRKGNKLIIL